MTDLTLCMIVKNEADWIARCLSSVQGLANQIVVVDTGSDDDTVMLAKSYGAEVYDYVWKDDFSDARNFSLKQAQGEWVLVLDADESVTRADHAKLRTLIDSSDISGYRMEQRTYGNSLKHDAFVFRGEDRYTESEPYKGWISSWLVRLFQNRPEFHYVYAVHELIEPAIESYGGRIEDCSVPIHHYSQEKSQGYLERKLQRYLGYGLRQIELTPNDPKPYMEVAMVYMENADYVRAEHVLLEALRKSGPNIDLYDVLATLYLDSARPVKAEEFVRKGLSLNPADPVLLNKLASVYVAVGKYKEADRILRRAKKISPSLVMTSNNFGLLYVLSGQEQRALKAFGKTLALDPGNVYALTSLGMLNLRLGRFDQARDVLVKAAELVPNDAKVQYHLGLVYEKFQQLEKAIQCFRVAKQGAPDDPAIDARLKALL